MAKTALAAPAEGRTSFIKQTPGGTKLLKECSDTHKNNVFKLGLRADCVDGVLAFFRV